MDIQKMSIEEKVALLSDTDKAYILGYVERALLETRKNGIIDEYQAAMAKQPPAIKKSSKKKNLNPEPNEPALK